MSPLWWQNVLFVISFQLLLSAHLTNNMSKDPILRYLTHQKWKKNTFFSFPITSIPSSWCSNLSENGYNTICLKKAWLLLISPNLYSYPKRMPSGNLKRIEMLPQEYRGALKFDSYRYIPRGNFICMIIWLRPE